MSIAKTLIAIRALGLTANWNTSTREFRVNGPGASLDSAYFTDDADDAMATARAMTTRPAQGQRLEPVTMPARTYCRNEATSGPLMSPAGFQQLARVQLRERLQSIAILAVQAQDMDATTDELRDQLDMIAADVAHAQLMADRLNPNR